MTTKDYKSKIDSEYDKLIKSKKKMPHRGLNTTSGIRTR